MAAKTISAATHRAEARPAHGAGTGFAGALRRASGIAALLVASGPLFAAVTADRADCDAAALSRTLRPAAAAALPAEAAWLDATRLRWAGAPTDGRYRLVLGGRDGLRATPGQVLRGAAASMTLTLRTEASADPAQRRYSHIGPGATLELPRHAAGRLPTWLRGEVLLVREDAAGRVQAATQVQLAGALDALYARAEALDDLGATFVRGPASPGQAGPRRATGWRLWAPTAQRVALCLYPDERAPAQAVLPMARDAATGSWSLRRAQDAHGLSYAFLVDVVVPGIGLVRQRVTDPYARSLSPDSRRAVAVDLDDPTTQPPGWRQTPRPARVQAPTDQVIYELHVRDFSVQDPGVPEADRGRYAAFAAPQSAGMRHLRMLAAAGLTDVHLLPVFDLATVPEQGCRTPVIPAAASDSEEQQRAAGQARADDCFNWGYDPFHYAAPEGSYASAGADGIRRILEFRRMVQALHAADLRVGMDVVYNHTSASGQAAHSVLDRIVPGYYHRLDGRGQVERSTCCDNTATEARMMAKLMIDASVIWARDHRIDAFRFDLMGHQPREAMERLQRAVDRAAGARVHLLGEGWNFGEIADGRRFVQASQLSLNGSGIGTFNDRLRDAVRGGGAGDNGVDQLVRQGFVNGLHLARNPAAIAAGQGTRDDLLAAADLVRAGLAGSLRDYVLEDRRGQAVPLAGIPYGGGQPAGYVTQPDEVVNYVENHDNQTLFDALVFKLPPDTSPAERARVQTLASATVLLAQGIAYVHAGQELLRSKSMDRNSYDSGDWFNRIDWTARDNGFGSGLPPAEDNRASWPLMQPFLARAEVIRPRPEDIAWARDSFRDLLRIRASTTLLRLRSADDIRQRLRLLNTGPQQVAGVVVGHLDGRGYPGAGVAELVYAINVDVREQELNLPALRGRDWTLHPVLAAPDAADQRAAQARLEGSSGRLRVPPRTAVVFVAR